MFSKFFKKKTLVCKPLKVTVVLLFGTPLSLKASSEKMTCETLSLNGEQSSARNFENTLQSFEKSFANDDKKLFLSLLHPLLKKQSKEPGLFEGILGEFGLKKAKLSRNSVFKVNWGSKIEAEDLAKCDIGLVRNLIGPASQIHVFHTFSGGNETIRLHSIFTDVLGKPSVQNSESLPANTSALVHFFAQAATHSKKTPAQILEQAVNWGNLGEPVLAALFSHAALRLVTADAYLISPETPEVLRVAEKHKQALLLTDSLREKLNSLEIGWSFLTLTPVFQANSIEVGLKVKMPEEVSVDGQARVCKAMGLEILKQTPALNRAFASIECLPYTQGESLQEAPGAGSQNFAWKELVSKAK